MTFSSQLKNINTIKYAAWSLALAVILGAMTAHALKPLLSPDKLTSFLTGVRYHFIHALALLIVALLRQTKIQFSPWVETLFKTGIVLFSGSIYLLATVEIHHQQWMKILGPITPLGGLCFIGGWVLLAISTKKTN